MYENLAPAMDRTGRVFGEFREAGGEYNPTYRCGGGRVRRECANQAASNRVYCDRNRLDNTKERFLLM